MRNINLCKWLPCLPYHPSWHFDKVCLITSNITGTSGIIYTTSGSTLMIVQRYPQGGQWVGCVGDGRREGKRWLFVKEWGLHKLYTQHLEYLYKDTCRVVKGWGKLGMLKGRIKITFLSMGEYFINCIHNIWEYFDDCTKIPTGWWMGGVCFFLLLSVFLLKCIQLSTPPLPSLNMSHSPYFQSLCACGRSDKLLIHSTVCCLMCDKLAWGEQLCN